MKYSIHARAGATLHLTEHFEEALMAMRRIDAAESVVRIEDGQVLATKMRIGRCKPLPAEVLS